ncbi:MAG: caspase family protein [Cytophagaceae bacterium]
MKPTLFLIAILLSCGNLFSQEVRSYQGKDLGHVHCLSFCPDGQSFVSGCSDHTIKQWNVSSGTVVRTIQSRADHTGPVHALAVSSDGKLLASANHSTYLYDLASGRKIRSFEGKHTGGVKAIAISPNGKYLATSGVDESMSVEIWNIETGKHLQTLLGHWGHVNALAFSPDGKILASGSNDHTIRFWELSNDYFISGATLHGHAENVHALSFSYDGKYLASGNTNHSIGVWEVATRRQVRTFLGHTGHVYAVAFSPDGNFLVSGSYDSTVRVWDVSNGAVLANYHGHTGHVNTVAFSPDGNYIISGSSDKTIRLWDCSNINITYFYKNDIQADLNANAKLFAPKDEFESSAEYEARKQSAEAYRASVIQKYKQNYPLLKKQKIKNSYKVLTFPIESIGMYNADNQTYPIRINGVTENIHMPASEARSFKENLKNIEVKGVQQLMENCVTYDVFNIQITHPITGSVYSFGKQKQALYYEEQVTMQNNSEAGVPALTATVKFQDLSGNNMLEGNESAQLIFKISNEGKGTAKNLRVNVTSDAGAAITYDKANLVSAIAAGQTQTITVNLRSDNTLQNGEITFRVSFEEERGFQPSPFDLTVSTQSPKVPQLSFVEANILETQGNGNYQIEKNETIEVSVLVQNKGLASAQDVRAVFRIDDANIVCINPAALSQVIGNLHPGETKTIRFSIAVNNNYNGANQLPVRVVLSESQARYGGVFPLGLELKKVYAEGQSSVIRPNTTSYTFSDVDDNIPMTSTVNPDAIAVIIGNSAYTKTKSVNYAVNDARSMKNYLIRVLGFKEGNILYYENASYSDFVTLFGDKGNSQGKLYNSLKPGKSDLYIFYSGHGAPGLKDQRSYFVPVECDPQYVELGGYSTDVFYENLALLPARSVTVVLDACFSGANIYDNISPALLKSQGANGIRNGLLLASSSSNQVSTWYNEKQHGMFTYFFLKAIKDKNADYNKDNQLTFEEIFRYVTDNSEGVPYQARRMYGIDQIPTLQGEGADRIFVKF